MKAAGVTLRGRYTPHARGVSLDEVVGEIHANDAGPQADGAETAAQ
ncbi:hypothetical protein [Streptomyces sp. NPDC001502]